MASGGYSLVVVCRLLSLRSRGSRALGLQYMISVDAGLGLWSTGSIVVEQGLSCSLACGIFLDQALSLIFNCSGSSLLHRLFSGCGE